jgi:Rieske 2Fe-2S family protein
MKDALLSRLKHRDRNAALAREFYCDPAIYQLDLETIWYREWLFAGHDCEVPGAGDYFTLQIGGYPLIVLRGNDGKVRAFHNTCRHRGSRICASAKGSAVRLTCPYHQWTYQLDGRLFSARDMGQDFDRTRITLKPVHCESVGGYIWVCLGAAAPDFDELREKMAPYFLPHGLHEAKVAFESTIIECANWKLVWENNRECYHCAANHPELCRTLSDDPAVNGAVDPTSNSKIAKKWAHWASNGLPSESYSSGDGQFNLVRMPLIVGALSYTMSGKPGVRRRLSEAITVSDVGTLALCHLPTTWNHVLGDHAVSFRVLPISATQTQLTTKWLVNRDAVEGVDYDLKTLTEVWLATNEEDRHICQENQIGVTSPAYEPVRYSPLHEGSTMEFLDWYAACLEIRSTESSLSIASTSIE